MNNTLHLVLKHKWYEMIESGIKTEEYREIKPYWVKRLLQWQEDSRYYVISGEEIHWYDAKYICNTKYLNYMIYEMGREDSALRAKSYTHVCFHLGYTSTTMTFKVQEITIGKGNSEWGAPKDKPVFIVKLGERVEA